MCVSEREIVCIERERERERERCVLRERVVVVVSECVCEERVVTQCCCDVYRNLFH